MVLLRTLLFVPGNKQRVVDKALASNADALVLDLEDSVAAADKQLAREIIRETLAKRGSGAPQLWVRVNGTASGLVENDLDAVVVNGLAGIMFPKADSVDDIRRLDDSIGLRENAAGIAAGTVKILPILETGKGIFRVFEIATASDRVAAITFGAEDYTLDVGAIRSKEGQEIFYARSAVVAAAAAARVQAIDTVFTDLDDEEGLIADCWFGRRLGFSGKNLIHPKQIEPVTKVFSPSPEEISYARRVVDAFNASGTGVISLDGKMIDPPVYERARRILSLAEGA